MLARSGSGASGAASAWLEASALPLWFSLSKTWVASSSSSQSMSSFVPVFAFAEGEGVLAGRTLGARPGRVLGGGGATDATLCIPLGWPDAGAAAWIGGELFVSARFGSASRPGGGGGLLAGGAARIDPDAGGWEAAGIPALDGRVDGAGGATGVAWGVAGPGMPSSVRFASNPGGVAGMFDDEPGGGGGAAAERSELFFPRPSKMSRSDPPPLLSFDIRDS